MRPSARSRKGLRLAIIAGGAFLILLTVGVFGISAITYQVMTSVNRCGQPDQANGHVSPADYQMPDYQAVAFPSRDGRITLSAWYIQAEPARASDPAIASATVIVVHGVSDCKRSSSALIPAEMLHQAGFAVLMLDLRNHGDSGRDDGLQAMGTKEYLDVLGAWDWLTRIKSIPPGQVGLFGESLGAASVIDAGGLEPRVAAVWADSPFYSADAEIDALITQSGAPDLRVPALLIGRIITSDNLSDSTIQPASLITRFGNRPLLITQGTADQTVPPDHLSLLAKAAEQAGVPVQIWPVPGSRHLAAMVDQPMAYADRLSAFFRQALTKKH